MVEQVTLYRGTYIDESINNIGCWFSTDLLSAKRYSRGKIIKIRIIINKESEGKYLLTRDIQMNGHHHTYGVWEKSKNVTWYYISPEYLNTFILDSEEIML